MSTFINFIIYTEYTSFAALGDYLGEIRDL
jgi:hypothetical protein